MAGYWRILLIAVGVSLATTSSARSATTDQTCKAAREIAARGGASKQGPADRSTLTDPACTRGKAMSNVEKALCLMLLGCMTVIGSQASRRKAIKAVVS